MIVSHEKIKAISVGRSGVRCIQTYSIEPGSVQAVGRTESVWHNRVEGKARAIICTCQHQKTTSGHGVIGQQVTNCKGPGYQKQGGTVFRLQGNPELLGWKGDQSTHTRLAVLKKTRKPLADVGSEFKAKTGIQILRDNGLIEVMDERCHNWLVSEALRRRIFSTGIQLHRC